jgi:hypothetical protein
MKLLSAPLAALAAAAAICFSPLAFAQGGAGPRPGTEAGLRCLLRQVPQSCEQMFVGNATVAARPWVWPNLKRDFNRGPLQDSKYFGRASAENIFDQKILIREATDEMDIFDVKFAHAEWSFYIGPADADGKIRYLAIRPYAPHDLRQIPR